MKYIIITESNEFYRSDKITLDEMAAVKDGVMDVLNIKDPDNPFYLSIDGQWERLPRWEAE